MAKERMKPYNVLVPYIGQEFSVLAPNPEKLPGKLMKLDMTRMLRGRNVEAVIKIVKKEDRLVGEFQSLKVIQAYIKRMMRKNVSWIEDSFSCKSKDLQFRIKPFMITKKKVHRSLKKELRENTNRLICEYVTGHTSEEIFEDVVKGTLQKQVVMGLKKIYPVAFFEIRILKIEPPKHDD